jgi:acetate kinase
MAQTPAADVLTINAGSSSIRLVAFRGASAAPAIRASVQNRDDANAIAELTSFAQREDFAAPSVIAHRIVHGGHRLIDPCLIDVAVEDEIARLTPLAPLHNPTALTWIRACRDVFGRAVAQVAVFDTAFFAQLPPAARVYPVPRALTDKYQLRRFGFHGLAHRFLWQRWRALRPDVVDGGRAITLQLGAGCSAAAIDRGAPRDTSMGFSPLEGLMMSTRSGDVDPGLVAFIQQNEHLTPAAMVDVLSRASGLRGISGEADMQKLLVRGDVEAQLALDMYYHRVRKYVGAYLAVLGGADVILLGGGVAEHAPLVRAAILTGMEWAGLTIDAARNRAAIATESCISRSDSPMQAWVIPVDEAAILADAADSVLRRHATMTREVRT